MERRRSGDETWFRLREWTKGSKASERLAAHVLRAEGFESVDPSHPLGGPDGLKDVQCSKDEEIWTAASYFPQGQKTFPTIRRKFRDDLRGVDANNTAGFAFVTNQELSLGERNNLKKAAGSTRLELYHLERISPILDASFMYGVRLEFLDIPMNKEEQLAFFASHSARLELLEEQLARVIHLVEDSNVGTGEVTVPLEELREFKRVLESITGSKPFYGGYSTMFAGMAPAHVSQLHPPLEALEEYKRILEGIAGRRGVLGGAMNLVAGMGQAHVSHLYPPLEALKEYRDVLEAMLGGKVYAISQVAQLQPPLGQLQELKRELQDAVNLAHSYVETMRSLIESADHSPTNPEP